MTNTYARAYTEVLEVLRHFSKKEYYKIPKEKIDFYRENMDRDYQFKIDPNIDLAKQNISKEANAILISLFRDYFATEAQKEILKKLLNINQEKLDAERREKYNPDDIFKKNVTNKKVEVSIHNEIISQNALIKAKECNILKRMIEKIKNFFMC